MRVAIVNGHKTIFVSTFRLFGMCVILLLSFLSAVKPLNLLPDMGHYKAYFEAVVAGNEVMVESSFVYLSKLVYAFYLNFQSVIFVYVLMSLYIKIKVFSEFDNRYYLLFLYCCSFLVLHEFIQIRVALAISFLMLSFVLLLKKNYFLVVLSWAAAIFFHVSAALFPVVCLLSLFLSRSNFLLRMTYFIFIVILLASIAGYTVFDNVIVFFPTIFQDKISIYVEMQSYLNESVNFLSVKFLIMYLILSLYIFKLAKISYVDKLLISMMLIILIFGVVISFLPSISFRVIELFGPFFIFLLAGLRRYSHLVTTIVFHSLFIISSLYYSYRLFL